jgi:hypothetical protein
MASVYFLFLIWEPNIIVRESSKVFEFPQAHRKLALCKKLPKKSLTDFVNALKALISFENFLWKYIPKDIKKNKFYSHGSHLSATI